MIFAVDNQANTETSCEDKAAFKYGKTKVRYHIIKWIYCRYYGILIKIDSKMLDVFKNDLVNAKCL